VTPGSGAPVASTSLAGGGPPAGGGLSGASPSFASSAVRVAGGRAARGELRQGCVRRAIVAQTLTVFKRGSAQVSQSSSHHERCSANPRRLSPPPHGQTHVRPMIDHDR
jgi:hypothetical protein